MGEFSVIQVAILRSIGIEHGANQDQGCQVDLGFFHCLRQRRQRAAKNNLIRPGNAVGHDRWRFRSIVRTEGLDHRGHLSGTQEQRHPSSVSSQLCEGLVVGQAGSAGGAGYDEGLIGPGGGELNLEGGRRRGKR